MAKRSISLGPHDVIGAALLKRARRDDTFREELLRDPRTVVERELGLLLPDRLDIDVQYVQVAPAGEPPRRLPRAVAVPA